jgi:hypothetical protein
METEWRRSGLFLVESSLKRPARLLADFRENASVERLPHPESCSFQEGVEDGFDEWDRASAFRLNENSQNTDDRKA